MFSNYQNYSAFSTESWYKGMPPDQYDSLEGIHDSIHNYAGGLTGHMSFIQFSAFDPIFFLHHAMVDRILAMWQVLYPESWVVPEKVSQASATTNEGQLIDNNWPLTPFFHSSARDFLTSSMVRDWTNFGYTYREVSGATMSEMLGDPEKAKTMRSQVADWINQLYSAQSPSRFALEQISPTIRRNQKLGGQRGQLTSDPKFSTVGEAQSITHQRRRSVLRDNKYREWIVNIHVDKQELNQPFVIHLFLGRIPPDSRRWSTATSHVGSMGVFASSASHPIKMKASHLVSGTVPITAALTERVGSGILNGLGVEDVKPYLQKRLRVRIVAAGGEVVDRKRLPTLGLHVASSLVEAPTTEDELPSWGEVISHFDLT
jgi:tyrosinase